MKSGLVTLGAAQKSFGPCVATRKWLVPVAIALLVLPSTRLLNGQGLLYTVTSTGDGGLVGSDAFCDDGTGECTLRAAIEASNSHPGEDGIDFNIPTTDPGFDPATGAWTINLTKALPDISAEVSITGPGADVMIVKRNSGGDYRIFNVTAPSGMITFSGLTITNGVAIAGSGGGINIEDPDEVNVTSCNLSENFADANGGAIAFVGDFDLNVTNCALHGNTAGARGGGIYSEDGTLNVTNCTVSDNATQVNSGGAIFNAIENTLNLTNSTLHNNFSGVEGGGLFNDGGPANVKSSIIAGNNSNQGTGPDVFSDTNGTGKQPIVSRGFNLIGKNSGAANSFPVGNPNANGDIVGTLAAPIDPQLDLAGLQDNGGPTLTIALLLGSPAIDRGTSAGLTGLLTTDQRGIGFARTFDDPAIPNVGGDGTDMGAFEVQTAAPTPTPSPSPTPTPTTFGNISTRLRVETGDNVLIGGFIITGIGAKKVMVRAIGPSLPLIDVLVDPTLELRDSAGMLVASNDNWMDAPNKQEIIDSGIAPTNDFESAILMSLDPGLYTAIVRGVSDTIGIGLVEAYDLNLAADSILANISTRGLVQTGDDVMIGGIIILGTDPQEVLLRAIGPSLSDLGVAGALADPILELHDKDGLTIATNDDWRSDQEADIMATTIPPTDDAESAILKTLTPDAYTAIVRSKDNTTGIALIEAYQLDD